MSRGQTISRLYSTIFNDDPLLLKEKRQIQYGAAMLQHFLVYRPLTTSKSFPVDLQRPQPQQSATSVAIPTLSETNGYKRGRQQRIAIEATGLTAAEVANVRSMTMVSNGSTSKRSINNFKNHNDAYNSPLPFQVANFEARVRIAAIGFRVAISKLEDAANLGESLSFTLLPDDDEIVAPEGSVRSESGRTKPVPGTSVQPWHDALLQVTERALDRGSQIVVLPEFALTPAHHGLAISDDLRDLCARARDDNFLFAGTRHDGRYNRGLVFSKRNGQPPRTNVEHWHYKAASAKGLGENVLGARGIGAFHYPSGVMINTDEALVAVGICYDTYDPTTFLNLFLNAVRSQDTVPRVILVPSFNPSPVFVALLRDLSFLARCAVVYVNSLHGDAAMFMCGFCIDDFDERLPHIQSKIQDRLKVLQNEMVPIIARLNGGTSRRNDASEFARKLDQRKALRDLDRRLGTLQGRGELQHLITIEDCPICQQGHAHGVDACFRDIQYFNLPKALLGALSEFRRDYFGREEFLPEPLRWANLSNAIRVIDGRESSGTASPTLWFVRRPLLRDN